MRKVSSIIAATALMISVSAASFAAAPAKKPAKKAAMKEWTFAVFLNCDNNLDRFGVEDQEEMARLAKPPCKSLPKSISSARASFISL